MRFPAVHIWHATLSADAVAEESLLAHLDAAERERAQRFHFDRDRRLFIFRCAMRREVLGRYTGISPEKLTFVTNQHGKPALPESSAAGLHFNLSKSRDRVLLAVAQGREVGVDIEAVRPMKDDVQIASRIFTDAEQHQLLRREGREREEYFFRIWARKEAVIKTLGLGLNADLQKIDLAEPGEISENWTSLKSGASEPVFWRDLRYEKEFAAASAVKGEIGQIEKFEWPGSF
jgi:4'-phosphopantetheinyl transferase